mgnify:CR=1 FL=1
MHESAKVMHATTNFAPGESTTLPNKNIATLNGAPLLSYVINAAKDIPLINNFVVTSDSEEYLNLAKSYSSDLLLRKRPQILANDTEKESLKGIFLKNKRDESDFHHTLSLIKQYEIIKECYQKASHYINLASNSLSIFKDCNEKNILENLTSFSLSRDF